MALSLMIGSIFLGACAKQSVPINAVSKPQNVGLTKRLVSIAYPEDTLELSLSCTNESCGKTQETFRFAVDTKMYIDRLTPKNCSDSADALKLKWSRWIFMPFCLGSSADVGHLPTGPAITDPPDARISGGFGVEFQCRRGQDKPSNGSVVAPVSVAGYEYIVQASAFPTRIANTIDSTGRFSVVLGGRPHPIAEPVIRPFGNREHATIWLKTSARVDCRPNDQTGTPSPLLTLQFSSTHFPTQKVWFTHNSQTDVIWTKNKGLFSGLWSLPPVPDP